MGRGEISVRIEKLSSGISPSDIQQCVYVCVRSLVFFDPLRSALCVLVCVGTLFLENTHSLFTPWVNLVSSKLRRQTLMNDFVPSSAVLHVCIR